MTLSKKEGNGVSALAANCTAPPFAGRNAGTSAKGGRNLLAELVRPSRAGQLTHLSLRPSDRVRKFG
jgi:hypothetical protein